MAEISAAEARSLAIEMKRGGIGKRERYRATFKDAWDRYAAGSTQALSATTWRRVESRIRVHALPAIGHIKLADLNPADVARVTDKIQGAVLANRTLEDLRAVLGHALTLSWVDRNVAAGLRKRRELPRERYLKREEVQLCLTRFPIFLRPTSFASSYTLAAA